MSKNINNPQDVNKYIEQQTTLTMGGEIVPIISNVTPAIATAGTYFYAIKADGAANLVLSSILNVGATEVIVGGNVTILAGDILYGSFSQFTVVSGKYIVYTRAK